MPGSQGPAPTQAAIVPCILDTTVYSVLYTLLVCSLQFVLYGLYCTVYSVVYIVFSVPYTVFSVLYTVYNLFYTVYILLQRVCSFLFSVYIL